MTKYVALIHHPVVDQTGKEVTTALTNLDLHDIARSCRTYGVDAYFIVHPGAAQRELAQRIIGHWDTDPRHDFRREALGLVRIVPTLDDAIAQANDPTLVATTARHTDGSIPFATARALPNAMLLLGTGFGLAQSVLDRAQHVLAPIVGPTAYNHLSVRSACAILLDRLYGIDESLAPLKAPSERRLS